MNFFLFKSSMKKKLPDVSTTIDSISDLISDDNMQPVIDGQQNLNNMRNLLEKSIRDHIPKVTESIQEAGKSDLFKPNLYSR